MSTIRKTELLVIGGGPGGFAVAYHAKYLYPEMKITLVRKEDVAIIPCAIPYMFSTLGTIGKFVLSDHPLEELGVDIEINEVRSVNVSNRIAFLSDGTEIHYERLVLATGSIPVKPPIPGSEFENVYYVYKDFKYLNQLLKAVKDSDTITIVGGGFVGVEFAEEIAKLGKKVTIVEMLPHCLQLNFDDEFCILAEEELRRKGITLKTGVKVAEILGEGRKAKAVKLENGEVIPTDLVIITVGMRPNTELAKGMGLNLNERGFIIVDEFMRTSVPNIFAIGDCAEKRDFLTGKPIPAMLSSIACMEAKVAATNLKNITNMKMYKGIVSVFITKVGDYVLGAAGYTESRARREGLNIITETVETIDKHPGTMPGTRKLKVKLIALKDTQTLIGAEVCGGHSAGELTNLLGTLIQKQVTISELVSLQIATHPDLTASPMMYPVTIGALQMFKKLR